MLKCPVVELAVVAEIDVDPAAGAIHAEGWQSWTPTTAYRLDQRQYSPSGPATARCGFGGSRPSPDGAPGAWQGDGLAVVDPGGGAPVVTIGTAATPAAVTSEVPVIRCSLVAGGRRVVVAADRAVEIVSSWGGLEPAKQSFASAFAAAAGVGSVRPAPAIWCSWYPYGPGVTGSDVRANVDAIVARELPVDVIQIDDGYQQELGDWLQCAHGFGSLAATVDSIRAAGFRAGIWLTPFLAGARSAVATAHPEWLLRDGGGRPVVGVENWGQEAWVLDPTDPGVGEWLRTVFAGFRALGIDFFKLDFLYAGALDGERHDRSLGSCAAYRHGLGVVREAAGADAYLLGCGAPILPSVGLLDAMRIGPDTGRAWEPGGGDMSLPGGRAAELTVRGRAYQHGRYWANDPDCLLLGPGVEHRSERVALMRECAPGGLRAISDVVADLDGWALHAAAEVLAGTRAVANE
jgi:alpha-galactosidase